MTKSYPAGMTEADFISLLHEYRKETGLHDVVATMNYWAIENLVRFAHPDRRYVASMGQLGPVPPPEPLQFLYPGGKVIIKADANLGSGWATVSLGGV